MVPGEWDGATTLSGLIGQFDGTVDPRSVRFWIAYDATNVYVAQRSTVQPREWSPQTPPIWFDKGDSSFVIGLAPGRANRGDEPSHYLVRVNLPGQTIAQEIVWKIKSVRLTFPRPKWKVNPEIKSTFNPDRTEWISEVAIPLESMKAAGLKEGEDWAVWFARDYEAGDQTAVAVSTDWKFGDGWRHYGRAFYNHYRFERKWPRASIGGVQGKASQWDAPRTFGGRTETTPVAVPDFSFIGYQRGGGLLVSGSERQEYGVYTGLGEKELTATPYDPSTGDFYARLGIGTLPSARKAVRGEIVIRKAAPEPAAASGARPQAAPDERGFPAGRAALHRSALRQVVPEQPRREGKLAGAGVHRGF